MTRKSQFEFALDDPQPRNRSVDLIITASEASPLSPAQVEFNKHMKALEKARAEHERHKTALDAQLKKCIELLLPLEEKNCQSERDLIFATADACRRLKLTVRRRMWIGDLIHTKIQDLLMEPFGLNEDEINGLNTLLEEFLPASAPKPLHDVAQEKFMAVNDMLKQIARKAGFELDLSDLDIHGDAAVFERKLQERLAAMQNQIGDSFQEETAAPVAKKRKPTKAALEREQRQQEMEEAKNRDFKTLYKQLAKVLHPDLETDPELKVNREIWMKRLTTARDHGDLREMLAIEMEWLGAESSTLAKASDEKLLLYTDVLKEQTAELKERTRSLIMAPAYDLLHRYSRPYSIRVNTTQIIHELQDRISYRKCMLSGLLASDSEAREIINQWADMNARSSK